MDLTLNSSMAFGWIMRILPLICNGISVNNCQGTSRHNDIIGVVKHAVTALALDNPRLESTASSTLDASSSAQGKSKLGKPASSHI